MSKSAHLQMQEVARKAEDERSGLLQYCRQCTDNQLRNVFKDETERAERNSSPYSEVGATAHVFAQCAQQIANERGIVLTIDS